jgi:hypothetical protein
MSWTWSFAFALFTSFVAFAHPRTIILFYAFLLLLLRVFAIILHILVSFM